MRSAQCWKLVLPLCIRVKQKTWLTAADTSQVQDGCLAEKSQHPGGVCMQELTAHLCDVQHCNIQRGVWFLPSLCSNEQMKVCMALMGQIGTGSAPISCSNKEPPVSQETPFQSKLHYQLAISSRPSHFLCLVDLTQAGCEAAAKKVFIRKYGSEGNI